MATLFISFLALIVGGLIGMAFGAIQNAAASRNKKNQKAGQFHNAWSVMPGSMRRVAFLLVALLLVQIGLPMLFVGDIQWIVSAGVVFGYGGMLYLEFRRHIKAV